MRTKFSSFCLLFLLVTSSLIFSQESASDYEELEPDYLRYKSKALHATVNYIEALFLTQYGPIRWKKQQWEWDPTHEASIAHKSICYLPLIDRDSIKPIFNRLIESTRDGHVQISYSDHRLATLPLKIVWIDQKALVTSTDLSKVAVGDEVVAINGLSPRLYASQQLYNALEDELPMARPQYTLKRLFARNGEVDALPDSEEMIELTLLRGTRRFQVLVGWSFIEQKHESAPDSDEMSSLFALQSEFKNKKVLQTLHKYLVAKRLAPSYLYEQSMKKATNDKDESEEEDKERDGGAFGSIREINGEKIAYFRLPDFCSSKVCEAFDRLLPSFNKESKALIIDIRGNPGGYCFVSLALLSRLSAMPLPNLLESTIIDVTEVEEATECANYLEKILHSARSDEEVHEIFESDSLLGLYLTRNFVKDWMLSFRAVAEEWEMDHTCTRFLPTEGMSFIEPHPFMNYTKPLFLLIDDKSGSCADLFPAILKDSGRATLLGRTTAGLGGSIRRYEFPNFTGISSLSLTRSLLLRSNQMIIEDLGVSPDFHYPLTLEGFLKPEIELESALEFAAETVKGNRAI